MRPPRSLQELPPRLAHFCLGVERFLLRELGLDLSTGNVVAACSGGADSTALTLILHCLTRKHGTRVIVAHLDHGLRLESRIDATFVAQLCDALGLELHSAQQDVAALAAEQRIGLEEAGRNARYEVLEEIRRKTGAVLVCTAHQLNDLAEDVLLRLARGAGWPGLGGLPGFDPQRRLLRPLLLTPKSELIGFLRGCQMPWREDASNALNSATRNRMRHQLLPLFLRENPNFLESVARLWRQARTDEDYWRQHPSGEVAESDGETLFVPHDRLADLHPAERLRLYKTLLDRLGAGQALSDTLYQLDQAASLRRDAVVQFPGLKIARITTAGVYFEPDPRAPDR